MEQAKKNSEDATPTCLIDLMVTSDVYKDSPDKITNDLIIAKLAATDTSRNTTITALCHLAKNQESRSRVREEIKACLQKYGLENAQ